MRSLLRFLVIKLCIQYLLFQSVIGQDCKFEWKNGTELVIDSVSRRRLPKIRDDEKPGTELLFLRTMNVATVTNTSETSSDSSYVKATFENNILILSLADHFIHYEEYEVVPSISIDFTFGCQSGTKKLQLDQLIEDTNNHEPTFQRAPYIYKLPMPFPKGIALNNFAPISARDIDLSNTNVTFHLNNTNPATSDFLFSWMGIYNIDGKIYYNASLITNKVINYVNNVTFAIFATDTGVPVKLTSSTDVIIQVDRENSFFRFTKGLYTADLTDLTPENANGYNIKFEEGEVSLAGGALNEMSYEIQKDLTGYSNNFLLEPTNDHSGVQISLKNAPEKLFSESSVVLQLLNCEVIVFSSRNIPMQLALVHCAPAKTSSASESTVLHIILPGSKNGVIGLGNSSADCDNTEYVAAIIVLAILLVAVVSGLIVVVKKYHRIRRKSSLQNAGINNSNQNIVPDMEEVQKNGGVSPNNSFRKSVAFNDTVEEIHIAKL